MNDVTLENSPVALTSYSLIPQWLAIFNLYSGTLKQISHPNGDAFLTICFFK